MTHHPELAESERRYREAGRRAEQLVYDLSKEQFNWRPEPDKWSVAECLDHLVVLGSKSLDRIEAAIERGHERKQLAEGPFRYGWFGRWFVRSMGAGDGRINMPTPKLFRPVLEAKERTHLLSEFARLQDRLVSAVHRANGLDLAGIKVRSSATPLLRISLGQWFLLIAAHQERHLDQAERVTRHEAFPTALEATQAKRL